MKTLVTGGVRSGKSSFAERLLPSVATYVATGMPGGDDAAWRARLEAHRRRRPASWRTVETSDVATTLGNAHGAVLLDDVGNWLTRTLDALQAWNGGEWHEAYEHRAARLVASIDDYPADLVIVTNEVGFGLVSPYASGRLFTDELGRLNQRIAAACDRVVLVVAGCPLTIKAGTS